MKECINVRIHRSWNEVDTNSYELKEWLKSICKVDTLPAFVNDYMVSKIEENAQANNIDVEIIM